MKPIRHESAFTNSPSFFRFTGLINPHRGSFIIATSRHGIHKLRAVPVRQCSPPFFRPPPACHSPRIHGLIQQLLLRLYVSIREYIIPKRNFYGKNLTSFKLVKEKKEISIKSNLIAIGNSNNDHRIVQS